jgi:DNA-binding Lrp family transcriptional regulator
MIKVTDAEIIALLRRRAGLTASEIEAHFNLGPTGLFYRLIKLAARDVIRAETVSISVRPGGGHETTGAQVRRYFPPEPMMHVPSTTEQST